MLYAMEIMRMSDLELLDEFEKVARRLEKSSNEYEQDAYYSNKIELIRNELLRRMK